MLKKILELDKELFIFLNSLGSENFDGIWLLITKQIYWIPLFVLFLYLILKNFGWRHALLIMVAVAVLVTITDQTTNFFKYSFQRLRPSSDPDLFNLMRAVQTRNSFGYFSGHASSSMAAAFFLFQLLKPYLKYMGFIFLWPFIFAYSRIYLGLHYPLDIISGYIWGILMALLVFKIYVFSRDKFFPDFRPNLKHAAHGESISNG